MSLVDIAARLKLDSALTLGSLQQMYDLCLDVLITQVRNRIAVDQAAASDCSALDQQVLGEFETYRRIRDAVYDFESLLGPEHNSLKVALSAVGWVAAKSVIPDFAESLKRCYQADSEVSLNAIDRLVSETVLPLLNEHYFQPLLQAGLRPDVLEQAMSKPSPGPHNTLTHEEITEVLKLPFEGQNLYFRLKAVLTQTIANEFNFKLRCWPEDFGREMLEAVVLSKQQACDRLLGALAREESRQEIALT